MTQISNTTTPIIMNIPSTSSSVQPNNVQATLYVGDLLPDISEDILQKIFIKEADVISVRVCRDSLTGRSLGYAYVNFRTAEDAHKAMENLNFTNIANKACRIMISHRDPSLRKSGKGNLFVKNLDKGLKVKALYRSFSLLGKILSFKLATDEKGHSKGFGFIHYEDEETVNRVILNLDGKLFQDKTIYVSKFVPKKDRMLSGVSVKFNNVFVKNFDESITDDTLKEYFVHLGEIISAKVMRNEDGSNKKFGFVSFKSFADAETAVATMNGKQITPEHKLFVGRAMKKFERANMLRAYYERKKQERAIRYQDCNLYVKDLVETIDDERLLAEFSKFGKITSAKIMKDDKGVSRGFGFVCFENPESASDAIDKMSHFELEGKNIYVGRAEPKELRRTNLMAKFARLRDINIPSTFYQQSGYMYPPIRPQRFSVNQYGLGAPPMRVPSYHMPPMISGNRRPPYGGQFEQFPHHSQMYRLPRSATSHTPRANGTMNMGYQQNHSRRAPGMQNGNSMNYINRPPFRPQQFQRDTQLVPNLYREPHSQGSKQNNKLSSSISMHPSGNMIPHGVVNDHPSQVASGEQVGSVDKASTGISGKELNSITIDGRKNILGNAIYKTATKLYPEMAGKITGIMLSSDLDLISKIQDENALKTEIIAVHQAMIKDSELVSK